VADLGFQGGASLDEIAQAIHLDFPPYKEVRVAALDHGKDRSEEGLLIRHILDPDISSEPQPTG
jgi:hypothetical protein